MTSRMRARGLRTRKLSGLQVFAVCLVAGLVAILVYWRMAGGPSHEETRVSLRAVGYERRVIYHSPQRPGFTAWTGAWIMPDKSLMTAFTQATGPVATEERRRTPTSIVRRMGLGALDPKWDFWGLHLSVVYLRSTDRGRTWRTTRKDRFEAPDPRAYTPQADIALPDGTIVRRVNGWDLRYDHSVPHTAFLQRLAPGARSWSRPEVALDPSTRTYQVTRLRRLRDGRLLAVGRVWNTPAGARPDALNRAPSKPLLLVSTDEGRTWRSALTIPRGTPLVPNEWDVAELPNGNLLAVFRTKDSSANRRDVRKQAVLSRRGPGWILTDLRRAPFPASGHPELLTTKQGPILHIATTGIDYTSDGGETWHALPFPGGFKYRSRYYPRAVQGPDGAVYVFSHFGWDNYYGELDQSIVMDKFRLKAKQE